MNADIYDGMTLAWHSPLVELEVEVAVGLVQLRRFSWKIFEKDDRTERNDYKPDKNNCSSMTQEHLIEFSSALDPPDLYAADSLDSDVQ
ncbi:unnamed protein product [Anisakis simplex]|uniref:DUF3403 domain-containing protein n=1 Tax=Anisakis simplex TaxID=6269 RepID=A0A0M3KGC0_ANISI|nr:unnamed protein product [Anisakis simplex]